MAATVSDIENALLFAVKSLGFFALVQSAGRQTLPDTICYPACFVVWDGDEDSGVISRPIDYASFKIIVQAQNYGSESSAANDVYQLNDLVRAVIRGKRLGFVDIEPFVCVSRSCTGYDDSEGMIEYTHTYKTRLYQPVITE